LEEEAQLNFILRELMQKIEGLESAALVSREGLIVSAILESGISEMHIAAMSAIILSTCERVLLELKKGELDICIIQGTDGKFIVMQAGLDYIIVGVLDEDARMDLAFINMRSTSNRILVILVDYPHFYALFPNNHSFWNGLSIKCLSEFFLPIFTSIVFYSFCNN